MGAASDSSLFSFPELPHKERMFASARLMTDTGCIEKLNTPMISRLIY